MGGDGVVMSLPGVLVGFGRVLMGLLVVALEVVIGCQMVVLGCFFVVLRGFVMCFVCHFGFPVGNLPARSYAGLCEIVVACSRRFTWITGNSRRRRNASRGPGGISNCKLPARLGSG